MNEKAKKEIEKLLKKKYGKKYLSVDIEKYVIGSTCFGTIQLLWGDVKTQDFKFAVWVPATITYMIDTSERRSSSSYLYKIGR